MGGSFQRFISNRGQHIGAQINQKDHNREYQQSIFEIKEWCVREASWRDCNPSFGSYTSYRHRVSNEQIERHCLWFDDEDQQEAYYEHYLKRLREPAIINTIAYQQDNSHQHCSTVFKSHVYVEHIPIRLSEITDIPFPENVYMLQQAFLGFEELYSIAGFFEIHEQQIGIDQYGAVKVWMNADYCRNYPQQTSTKLQPESTMVNDLIRMVQVNTEEDYPFMPIQSYFSRKCKFPTFSCASLILKEYVSDFHVRVPPYCESVLEIFRDLQLADFPVQDAHLGRQQPHCSALQLRFDASRLGLMRNNERSTVNRSCHAHADSPSNTDRTVPRHLNATQPVQSNHSVLLKTEGYKQMNNLPHLHSLSRKNTSNLLKDDQSYRNNVSLRKHQKAVFTDKPMHNANLTRANQSLSTKKTQRDVFPKGDRFTFSENRPRSETNGKGQQRVQTDEHSDKNGQGRSQIDPQIAADLLEFG